jgi:hypothetical protein
MAFAVFGDGPYRAWEMGRYRRLIEAVNQTDLQWFLHVGDLFWYPCADENLAESLDGLNTIRHPVVYTPGDNEWTDCHERITGRHDPLDRLARIRATFFANPTMSLGGERLLVESQGSDPTYSEFVENVRWRSGGFVFATLHIVGSGNGGDPFPGRTSANDEEVVRRTAAALSWLDDAFAIAETENLHGVVLAMHGDPWEENTQDPYPEFAPLVRHLTGKVTEFSRSVLLIHGDSHTFIVDHPLRHVETGEPLENFTRLETFGSPDIGWVRVVIDTVEGRVVAFEPRRIPSRLFW